MGLKSIRRGMKKLNKKSKAMINKKSDIVSNMKSVSKSAHKLNLKKPKMIKRGKINVGKFMSY